MERINGQQPEHAALAKKVLLWIAFARRELKVIELQHALATGHEPQVIHDQDLPFVEKMVTVCAGLVTIDETTNVIRLVHFTTQEYINQQPGELLPMTEQYITRTCVKYLFFSNFKSLETCCGYNMKKSFIKQLEFYPFYDYAANNWGHHARDSPISRQELEGLIVEGELQTSLQLLLVRGSFMEQNSFCWEPFDQQSVTKLHMAAYFGLRDLVEDLLRAGFEIDCKDSHGRTPLSYSAELGWETTVSLLVNAGAEVDSQAVKYGLNKGRTPLSYAAEAGHEGITQILLNNEASLTSISWDGYGEKRTSLMYAAEYGHEGVVRLLLDKYIELDCQDQDQDQDLREGCDGSTALEMAVQSGYERVVRLLVQHASNPDLCPNFMRRTPLSIAAGRGNEVIVRLLLDTRRVSVNSLSTHGFTPLLYAAYEGHMAVIQLLLSGGADINLGQCPMKSPIVAAAEAGYHDVVQVLLEKGANPDGGVSTGGYNCVTETLYMTPGWNRLTDNQLCYGRTPLSYMSEKGHESVVRLLLEKGADVNSAFTKTTESTKPAKLKRKVIKVTKLSIAAKKGPDVDRSISKTIVLKGEDMGRTPLSFAAEKGHEAVVRLLLEREKVDPDSVDYKGRTPFSYAAENGHEEVAELLLERDKLDLVSSDDNGGTPLSYAIRGGYETIVRLLLEKAVNVEKRYIRVFANKGFTPVEYAQLWGHEGIVRMLTENGSSQWENEQGWIWKDYVKDTGN